MSILTKFFGDPNAREVTKHAAIVKEINGLEPTVEKLTQDEIRARMSALRTDVARRKGS